MSPFGCSPLSWVDGLSLDQSSLFSSTGVCRGGWQDWDEIKNGFRLRPYTLNSVFPRFSLLPLLCLQSLDLLLNNAPCENTARLKPCRLHSVRYSLIIRRVRPAWTTFLALTHLFASIEQTLAIRRVIVCAWHTCLYPIQHLMHLLYLTCATTSPLQLQASS